MGTENKLVKALPFNCENQSSSTWRQRADLCAELMKSLLPWSEQGFSLADIGCGDQKLRASIDENGICCRYHGYDLFPQVPGVRQLDVENESLPQSYDLAVMLGVIEYLEDVEQTFQRLSRQASHLIVSHVIRQEEGLYTSQQLAKLNWRNHLSEAEMEAALSNNGFVSVSRAMAPDRRTMLFACRSRVKLSGAETSPARHQ